MCIAGKAGLHHVEQVAVLKRRHVGIDAALHADLGGAPGPRVSHFLEDGLVGMVIGVGLPALAFEAAELASDETDIGEIDVAIDDVGDFVADVFGARQVGAFDHRAQIGALAGVKRQTFLAGQFAAVQAFDQRRADRGRGVGHQGVERGGFDLVDIVAQFGQVHTIPPRAWRDRPSRRSPTAGSSAGSIHSSLIYSWYTGRRSCKRKPACAQRWASCSTCGQGASGLT